MSQLRAAAAKGPEPRKSHVPGKPSPEVKKVDVPLEAICRVTLSKAEIVGNTQQSFDFNQETKLVVKVFGSLHFPPDAPPLEETKSKGKQQHASGAEGRWKLNIT